MALIHPVRRSTEHAFSHDKTRHPGVCLLGMFSFLCATAFAAHLIFQAIVH